MSGGPRDGRGESGGADPRQQRHEAVLGLSTWLKIDMISRGKESRRRGTAAPPPSFPLSLSNLGSVSLSHLQTRHPTHPVFILRPARSPATHSSAFSPLLPSCPFSFFFLFTGQESEENMLFVARQSRDVVLFGA